MVQAVPVSPSYGFQASTRGKASNLLSTVLGLTLIGWGAFVFAWLTSILFQFFCSPRVPNRPRHFSSLRLYGRDDSPPGRPLHRRGWGRIRNRLGANSGFRIRLALPPRVLRLVGR